MWEFDAGDANWCAFDDGNPNTIAFVESRHAEFSTGGAPRRIVRIKRQDYKIDFSRMTMRREADHVIFNIRRRGADSVNEESEKPVQIARKSIPIGFPGHPLRGLSVHYLSDGLLKELKRVGLTTQATIRDVEPTLIRSEITQIPCPRDGSVGAAFVDAVSGEHNVGHATHMLSYTWGYEIGEIVDSLVAWCEKHGHDKKEAKIWMCCFCINQYRVIEAQKVGTQMPFEVFREEFESRVRGIGKVIALMGSWKMTLYTTRVWCVFELYTAMELQSNNGNDNSLEILLSPREASMFRETLIDGEGLDSIWKALTHIRVEKADSFAKHDRDQILELVRNGPGYGRVNKEIINLLHEWFAANSEGYLRERMCSSASDVSSARACARVGEMLERVSQLDKALDLLLQGRKMFEATGTMNTVEGATLLRVKGTIQRRKGNLDEALACYQESKAVHLKCKSHTSTEFATLLQELGKLNGDFSKLDAELKCHEKALKIRNAQNTIETPEGAGLYRSLGMVHFQTYDYTRALDFFTKSKALHEKTESLETPEGAASLQSIGDVMSSMHPPKLHDALLVHQQAHDISEQLGISTTPQGVAHLRRFAFLCQSLEQPDRAKQLYARADEIIKAQTKCAKDSATEKKQILDKANSIPWTIDFKSAQHGTYFEVVPSAGFKDPRGFPNSLCSFKMAATAGILPTHLKISWGALESLTVEGRDWEMDSEVFSRSPHLGKLQRVVSTGVVKGYLSPLHAVNLDDTAKERAGIPARAKHFMFSYPVSVGSQAIAQMMEDQDLSNDPDIAFLLNGGYVYLDKSMDTIVRINAIIPSDDGGLKFGPPLKWEGQWSNRLLKADRFRPITIDAIRASGATHFCWIRPNEVMWFEKTGGSPICPYGGFAYIRYNSRLEEQVPEQSSSSRKRSEQPSPSRKRTRSY